jgi:hypothetical protein
MQNAGAEGGPKAAGESTFGAWKLSRIWKVKWCDVPRYISERFDDKDFWWCAIEVGGPLSTGDIFPTPWFVRGIALSDAEGVLGRLRKELQARYPHLNAPGVIGLLREYVGELDQIQGGFSTPNMGEQGDDGKVVGIARTILPVQERNPLLSQRDGGFVRMGLGGTSR